MRTRTLWPSTACLLLAATLAAPAADEVAAVAQEESRPTLQAMIAGLFFDDHSYMAESSVRLPMLHESGFGVSYYQHEMTPILREGAQTQLLTTWNGVEAAYATDFGLRVIGIGGFHRTANQDRPGSLQTWELGLGLGSLPNSAPQRFEWSVTLGGYAAAQRLDADWWANLSLTWRTFDLPQRPFLETGVKPFIGLGADVESANDGAEFHALYRVGPIMELVSGNGNIARFRAQWYANDGNPFYETRFSSLLVGVEVSTSLDVTNLFDMRDQRRPGWLPVVWGEYDAGVGVGSHLQTTELTAEIHDIRLGERIITPIIWYESRQDYRDDDYDNVSYTVSLGMQTVTGWPSLLTQSDPIVLGVDYLHRSAHALAPDESRVPAGTVLPHDSVNLVRVRAQSQGWDLPYRDPTIYSGDTRWLNHFDWRVTLGYDFYHSRDRGNPAMQFGLNWDAATLRGCVAYARGVVSVANETPDWRIEAGVRHRPWKLFLRWEDYGLESQIAEGPLAVVGLGIVL